MEHSFRNCRSYWVERSGSQWVGRSTAPCIASRCHRARTFSLGRDRGGLGHCRREARPCNISSAKMAGNLAESPPPFSDSGESPPPFSGSLPRSLSDSQLATKKDAGRLSSSPPSLSGPVQPSGTMLGAASSEHGSTGLDRARTGPAVQPMLLLKKNSSSRLFSAQKPAALSNLSALPAWPATTRAASPW